MCLEKKIHDLTVVMDALTATVEQLVQINLEHLRIVQAQGGSLVGTSGTENEGKSTDAQDEKPAVDDKKTEVIDDSKQVEVVHEEQNEEPKKGSLKDKENLFAVETPNEVDSDTEDSDSEQVDPVHTHKELKDVLNEYKEKYGIAMAKKLMPKMGYSHSSKVPLDKLDSVYDEVRSLIDDVDL